jgi:hypothetical protein
MAVNTSGLVEGFGRLDEVDPDAFRRIVGEHEVLTLGGRCGENNRTVKVI